MATLANLKQQFKQSPPDKFRDNTKYIQMLEQADIHFKNYKNVSPIIQLIMFEVYKAQAKYLKLNDAEFDSIKYYYQALKLSEVIYHPQHKTRQRLLRIYNELSDQFQIEIVFNELEDKKNSKKMNINIPMKNYSVMVNQIYTKRKNIISFSKPQAKRPISVKPTQQVIRPVSAKIPEYKKTKPVISINKSSRPQSSTTAPKQSLTFRLNSKHNKPVTQMQQPSSKDLEGMRYQRILDLMIERPQSHHVPEIIISQPPIQESVSQKQTVIERELSKQQIQTLTMRKSSSSAIPSFQFINRERDSQRKIQAPKELNVDYPGSKMTQSARQLTNPQVTDEQEDENDSSSQKLDNLMDDFDEILDQDNVLGFYLKKYTQQQLEKAIDTIITWYREQVLRRNLNIPIKPKQSPNKIARGSTIQIKQQKTNTGFISVMNNLLNENETSKSLLFLFENALKLGSKPIYFYSQLFKDSCTQLWMLKSPKVKIQILQKDGRIHLTEDIETIRNEFQSIQTRNLDTFALQCTIQLENYSQKMQFRFIIDNVLDCLNELEQFQDIMNLFNQLITVYLQQNDIFVSWQEQHHEQLILYTGGDVGQLLLSKVLFLIQKLKYVKAINGYKFKWEGQQHDTNILKSNNKIYKEQKNHIQQIFQINKSEVRRQKVISINQRRVRRNRNLVIVKNNLDYQDSTPASRIGDASPQLSYLHTGMIIESSQQSISYNFSPDTPMIRRIDKQPERFNHLITPQWKSIKAYTEQQFATIEEIFSLEMQDFLEYYFPDFPLAIPPEVYDPNPQIHEHQPKQPKIDYEVSGHYDNYKYIETKYSNILPFQYIILTQIIKLDNQYYLITLSNKLQIQQLLLKDTWSDEIRINLSDLIDFKIGRTGYILDKIKLQEEIISRIQIENCKVYLLPKQVQNKNQLFKNQMLNYIQENQNKDNLQKRDRIVDSVFLLSLHHNTKVYVQQQITLPFINYVDESCIELKPEEPKIKLKMPSRLLLSFEDINKHISRTYDNTILGDVRIFKKYNSIFSMYSRKLFRPLKIKFIIQYEGDVYRQYKQNNITGYIVVFLKQFYKVVLNSQQIEQWAHILGLEGKMQEIHIKHALQLKRTISGKKLPQITNMKTVSKDIRILMFQGKVKTKEVFQQSIIPNIGKVFIRTSALKGSGSNLLLIEIQLMKERTRVHKFLMQCNSCSDYFTLQDYIQTISKYLQLRPTATYKRLYMTQITSNSLKQQYLLSNNFRDNIIMKAVKPHMRVIYKQVRRFNKHFYIITILKMLNHFQIILYNQNTCRRFSIRLHSCDFAKFGEDFLNYILPKQQEEVLTQLFRPWTLQEINKIYSLLIKAPELFKQKTKRIITSIDLKRSQTLRSSSRRSNTLTPSMRASIYNKQSSANIDDLDFQEQEIQVKDNFLFNILIKQTHSSVFEMKLWMELTKDLRLKENYLILDSERFLLTEILYNNYQHIYFETYMDCTETHQLYRWQPARFRIYFYENYRVIDQPLIYRGKQFQMHNQSDKLYHNFVNNKILPPQQDRIIVNKANDNQLHGYQLIYKGVFTKTQMMAIFYIDEEFQIKIWNSEKSIIRKFTMSQIEQKIPFVKFLIQLKPYEVGRRIYLTYRNQLIHAAFFNL